jgi:AbrB family looped-hinge helix DNA binding protein
MKKDINCIDYFGSTLLGKRGQIVIPIKLRKKMGLKTGDRFIIFSHSGHFIVLAGGDQLNKIVSRLSKRLDQFKKIKI